MIQISNLSGAFSLPRETSDSLFESFSLGNISGSLQQIGVDIQDILKSTTVEVKYRTPLLTILYSGGTLSSVTNVDADIILTTYGQTTLIPTRIDLEVSSDFSSYNLSGKIYLPLATLFEYIQKVILSVMDRIPSCNEDCSKTCPKEVCEPVEECAWWDFIGCPIRNIPRVACQARNLGTVTCAAECLLRTTPCKVARDLVPQVPDLTRVAGALACLGGKYTQYSCQLQGETLTIPFSVDTSGVRVGGINVRKSSFNFDAESARVKSNCRALFLVIGPLSFSGLTIRAAICFSLGKRRLDGDVAIGVTTPQDEFGFSGYLLRKDNSIYIRDGELVLPDNLPFDQFLSGLSLDSLEISNDLVISLGLKPIFGISVLDLLERALPE